MKEIQCMNEMRWMRRKSLKWKQQKYIQIKMKMKMKNNKTWKIRFKDINKWNNKVNNILVIHRRTDKHRKAKQILASVKLKHVVNKRFSITDLVNKSLIKINHCPNGFWWFEILLKILVQHSKDMQRLEEERTDLKAFKNLFRVDIIKMFFGQIFCYWIEIKWRDKFYDWTDSQHPQFSIS